MKMYTQVVSVGEWLGPIDWAFGFFAEPFYPCTSEERRRECIQNHVSALRDAERLYLDDVDSEVLIGASIPSWRPLLRVGMYDGWPHWKPYPSLLVQGTLGGEVMPWSWLSAARATAIRKDEV